jgi:hypothetical protein
MSSIPSASGTKRLADSVRKKFDHMLDANGLQGEWHRLDAINMNVSSEFCSAARVADLAIIAKVDPDSYCGVEAEFMGNVIMGAGQTGHDRAAGAGVRHSGQARAGRLERHT